MRKPGFALVYILLLAAQVLLLNFGNFTQYLSIIFLPAMILCLPINQSTTTSMIIAFFSGFAIDFLAGGALGLTSLALVPVAACRKMVILFVFGSELESREENISIKRQGSLRVILACLIVTALFLIIYIAADGAGTRPLWFNTVKWIICLIVDTFVSFFICELLTSDSVRWK